MTGVLAAAADEPDGAIGPGLLGFLVMAFMALAVVFLYRSMRKQLKRIDFNAEGRTDAERAGGRTAAERARGRDASSGGPQQLPDPGPGDEASSANGHRGS